MDPKHDAEQYKMEYLKKSCSVDQCIIEARVDFGSKVRAVLRSMAQNI